MPLSRKKREHRFPFVRENEVARIIKYRARSRSMYRDAGKTSLYSRRLCERRMHTAFLNKCVTPHSGVCTVTVDFPWECERSVPRSDQGFALPIRSRKEQRDRSLARSLGRRFLRTPADFSPTSRAKPIVDRDKIAIPGPHELRRTTPRLASRFRRNV